MFLLSLSLIPFHVVVLVPDSQEDLRLGIINLLQSTHDADYGLAHRDVMTTLHTDTHKVAEK